ncbi:pyridoxal phosphate-dependent aminotransferase family protein [uncultured Microscilla sp.]|uniref:aminotransferase class I/II-fold pyridoxal phosphate-dependent enzyme n=1 Tax=uncultured Microscilla sp. TaxID=432653 RepID=UPI00261E3F2D|nr:pyridoxal phosphate-dependent aminotransferase family protein [uncultured Microscilla sp.]
MDRIKTSQNFLDKRLQKRQEDGLLRTLVDKHHLIDFCSNDYLGMARSDAFKALIEQKVAQTNQLTSTIGATGSRLISGNLQYTEQLEQSIADFHQAEAGLLFNSGYDANIGIFAALAHKGDTIITDEFAHASMIDGARLSHAKRLRFKHNNVADLEKKLGVAEGNVFIGVESVYSMDGDLAPLKAIADLAEKYGAHLIVDEAHATGVFGNKGEGVVQAENLQERVLLRMHTFGKALGTHGAIVLGSHHLRDYLINFTRSFIYTTSLPFHSLLSIEAAYELLPGCQAERQHLQYLIDFFQKQLRQQTPYQILDSPSPIQGVIVPGNAQAKAVSQKLATAGFYVKAILSPTVPAKQERLRICLHAFNTEAELRQMIETIKN